MIENRWFGNKNNTQDRVKHRVSKDVQFFKPFMHAHKDDIVANRFILIIRDIRNEYGLCLNDSVNLYVFLMGMYNNEKLMKIYTIERFDAGKKIAATLAARHVGL